MDYLEFYVVFNSQGHIVMGSLQVEETSAYCTVNHRASASNTLPLAPLLVGRGNYDIDISDHQFNAKPAHSQQLLVVNM